MNQTYTAIRVVIADDHAYFRKGFKLALTGRKEVQVIAEASNGKELFTQVQKHLPDVVITDVRMPEMDGIEVTRLVKHHYPKIKIIVLSMHEETSVVKAMVAAGASAYLLKHADVADIIAAIQATHRGKFYVSVTILQCLGSVLQYTFEEPSLTKREIEIIQLLFKEFTSKEIGEQLNLSVRTVEEHRKHLQKKTGTRNVVGLMKYALRHKIVQV